MSDLVNAKYNASVAANRRAINLLKRASALAADLTYKRTSLISKCPLQFIMHCGEVLHESRMIARNPEIHRISGLAMNVSLSKNA